MSGYFSIWMLTINKVGPTPDMVISGFKAQRYPQATEYYASKTAADARREEIYSGLKKLVGFIEGVEVEIKEVKVLQ